MGVYKPLIILTHISKEAHFSKSTLDYMFTLNIILGKFNRPSTKTLSKPVFQKHVDRMSLRRVPDLL